MVRIYGLTRGTSRCECRSGVPDRLCSVASKLEDGHQVEVVELRRPAGKTGYVMKIELEAETASLYVKLELGSGTIFGQSFHYSEYP